jgi:predicted aconitase
MLIYALVSLSAYIIIGLLFAGCSTVIEKPVPYAVPVKCNINMPSRPDKSKDVVSNSANIAAYAQTVESALKFCTGESDE